MTFASKIVGLMLIAALSVATFVTGAWAEADHASKPLVGLGERAAGCHGHDGEALPRSPLSPSRLPMPMSYQCCLTGHDAAVVQAYHFAQPPSEVSRLTLQIKPAPTAPTMCELEVSIVLYADPRGPTPLRI
jgi:hypothetical protein